MDFATVNVVKLLSTDYGGRLQSSVTTHKGKIREGVLVNENHANH